VHLQPPPHNVHSCNSIWNSAPIPPPPSRREENKFFEFSGPPTVSRSCFPRCCHKLLNALLFAIASKLVCSHDVVQVCLTSFLNNYSMIIRRSFVTTDWAIYIVVM
jgi:hypothetical protein